MAVFRRNPVCGQSLKGRAMIEKKLQALSPLPLRVVWHKNRATYLSIRKEKGGLCLRLHRLFLEASDEVIAALIRLCFKKDREAKIVIKKMAHLYFSQNKMVAKPLNGVGKVYDLYALSKKIQKIYFSPEVEPVIGWGKDRSLSFRSMTFGSYDRQQNLIRIHPFLDDEKVPLYFVEFIIYHEMLHAVCPSQMSPSGRCLIHTREFREKERQFSQFKEAKEWEKRSLSFFRTKYYSKKRKKRGILERLERAFGKLVGPFL